MYNKRISFSPPDISEAEINEVVSTLQSGWITTGPKTKLLERRLTSFIKTGKTDLDVTVDNCNSAASVNTVCLNSATAAEELNLRILGIGAGDEVIVPAYTYTSTAAAVVHCGAKPVFVDIQKDGASDTHMPEMDYKKVGEAMTPKTKAIIAVDLGGIICDYEKIFEIAHEKRSLFSPTQKYGNQLESLSSSIQESMGRIAVIADSAHSLGASKKINGGKRYSGDIADFSSFSFHAVKNLTTAEGGAAVWRPIDGIKNEDIYHMYQLLSLHGQDKDALEKTMAGSWEYDIIGPWYKCNMTDIMASIGLRQLDRYLSFLERRKTIVEQYDETCCQLGLDNAIHMTDSMNSSRHLYLMRVPHCSETKRNKIINALVERGVPTNVHYKPLPMMTAYGKDCSEYPNAYDYYSNEITLPLHTSLSDSDVDYICKQLVEVISILR